MNNYRKTFAILLATTTLGLAAAPALAEKGYHSGDYCDKSEKMSKHFERRMDQLHDDLKLTPAQEAGWKEFTTKMEPPADTRDKIRTRMAEWDKLTVPQRMQSMLDGMKAREAEMVERAKAATQFYESLTPEQKKIMDDGFMSGRGFKH